MTHEHNKQCKCLDSWDDLSCITHITIGDVNHRQKVDQNLINTLLSISNSSSSISSFSNSAANMSSLSPTTSMPHSPQYQQRYLNSYSSTTPSSSQSQINIPQNNGSNHNYRNNLYSF